MAELGYGKWSLKMRGAAAVVAVSIALVIASNIYMHVQASHEHKALIADAAKTRCVLALDLDQRKSLLGDRLPGAWGRACWWLEEGH